MGARSVDLDVDAKHGETLQHGDLPSSNQYCARKRRDIGTFYGTAVPMPAVVCLLIDFVEIEYKRCSNRLPACNHRVCLYLDIYIYTEENHMQINIGLILRYFNSIIWKILQI